MLVGLDIVDEDAYAAYREAMKPILERHGGGFRLDFTVAKTLKSDVPHGITRVFAIHFPDAERRDRFFSDPEYRLAKERHFARAVRHIAVLAEYVR